MPKNNQPSRFATVLHTFPALEDGATLAGYAALISDHGLLVPAPDSLCAIGTRHKKYQKGRWRIFTPRHKPVDSLRGHLTFALKHEGIELGVLKSLFAGIEPKAIAEIVRLEPSGAYSRRIWFLYEWLCGKELELEDATQGNFVELVNSTHQYPGPSRKVRRHRIRNNLPGTQGFCPLVRRTEKLDRMIALNLSQAAIDRVGKTHPDLLSRAAAFLLLQDSKASYTIEGESPPHNRIERWGRVIGEAGQRKLSIAELEYLQHIVIADKRFVTPGCRKEEGFIGDHDRATGMPIPVHLSARAKDVRKLLSSLIETCELLSESDYDPVLTAALIAFGFVFIHPFADGNGRIHRYLFHHLLAEKGFVPKGLVFPVSAVILARIDDYRRALEHYSKPRLEVIEWRPTDRGNVEILNETSDLYSYFDATRQAEFLYECVAETVNTTMPEEVDYLKKYDLLAEFIKNSIDMPNGTVDLLIRFLRQNHGKLSRRARDKAELSSLSAQTKLMPLRYKEFIQLTEAEVQTIERKYDEIFLGDR